MTPVEDIRIVFSNDRLLALNLCLAFIMFGIALGIQPGDFRAIGRHMKGVWTGVASQFLLLPALTFTLVWAMQPHPSLALGLLLVACCPGGNVSNYISSIGGANTALSVSLTAISTLLCPVLTPINLKWWASLNPETGALLRQFVISFGDMLHTVVVLLVLPLIAGIWLNRYAPRISEAIRKPVSIVSFLILIGFIGLALVNNWHTFRVHLGLVFLLVLLHNAIAFAGGFGLASAVHLPKGDRRSVTIETGIQNSGLGLIVIFTFFQGNGGMAIVAAWWGVWHIIAGLTLAALFRLRDRKAATHT